ncbi:sensor histidine kinase [Spirosoma aerophilum]
MRFTVKTKIWMAVVTIVSLFACFLLFYLPAVQEQYLLTNYNKEVQSQANTVALGVRIAITEQNFKGVQMAMDFAKNDPQLKFVSLIQTDTLPAENQSASQVKRTVFMTYPENVALDVNAASSDSMVIKRAAFNTPSMNGEVLVASSTNEIIQTKKQIRATSLFFSFVVLALGILMGLLLARNISVPVLELRDAANKVGEGDLTQRVSRHSNDEIGELGVAFNTMVNDLANARQEASERTADLIREKKKSDDLLVDLQNTLANLKETQEQLIRQEKLASIGQLTKGLVDRLLNPLNYINNFAAFSKDLLVDMQDGLSHEKYATDEIVQDDLLPLMKMAQTNVEKINEHGSSLTRIVRSMEKLLKTSSTQAETTQLTSLIERQVERVLETSKQLYDGFQVQFFTDFSDNCRDINTLSADIESVIGYLLDNSLYSVYEKSVSATEYMPTISIETTLTEGLVNIKIRDNGKGIPAAEVKQLFSPFFTTKPTAKGTGLGLYISQDVIRMHKGNITVDTEEGRYATFTIELPV